MEDQLHLLLKSAVTATKASNGLTQDIFELNQSNPAWRREIGAAASQTESLLASLHHFIRNQVQGFNLLVLLVRSFVLQASEDERDISDPEHFSTFVDLVDILLEEADQDLAAHRDGSNGPIVDHLGILQAMVQSDVKPQHQVSGFEVDNSRAHDSKHQPWTHVFETILVCIRSSLRPRDPAHRTGWTTTHSSHLNYESTKPIAPHQAAHWRLQLSSLSTVLTLHRVHF